MRTTILLLSVILCGCGQKDRPSPVTQDFRAKVTVVSDGWPVLYMVEIDGESYIVNGTGGITRHEPATKP